MKSKVLLSLVLLLSSVALSGCGSSDVVKPTVEQNVFASIEALGDSAGDDEMFATAFVSGTAPENRKDYALHGYQVNGEPTFSGDTVTVPVKIYGGVQDSSSGDNAGKKAGSAGETEMVWTLQRVEDQWKLKDAPLG